MKKMMENIYEKDDGECFMKKMMENDL